MPSVSRRDFEAAPNRILGGIAGGFVGAIVYAIAHILVAGVTISGLGSIVLFFLPGFVAGVILGVLFPRLFTWLADLIGDAMD